MSVITFKTSRVRRPSKPRTCCATHNDRCLFGRPHAWSQPFYDALGAWRDDGAYLCECGAICEADVS
jgi:hypothetical protein